MHWEVFWIVASCLFIAVIGLPMALDKIPPNALYGFRTPRTLADPDVWYEANREAGKALTAAGLVGALGSVLAGWLVDAANPAMFASIAAMMLPLFVAVVYSFYKASAFAAEKDSPGVNARLLSDGEHEGESAMAMPRAGETRTARRPRGRQG